MNIEIIDYQAQYQPYFESFNKAWLQAYFYVEPIDQWVLANPEEAILKEGGCVLRLLFKSTGILVFRKFHWKKANTSGLTS